MCTLVILHRPAENWPLILGANRDEMIDRPWAAPGRHWPDRPEIFGGLDRLAGGSWLAVNDHGVAAGVLNRPGTLGPQPGTRSRGELVLEALDHADAAAAASALSELDARAYRPFHLVIADSHDAFWIKSPARPRGKAVQVAPVTPGLSMITSADLNSADDSRIAEYLPRFRAASTPIPETGDWRDWEALLGGGGSANSAMTIATDSGFGTTNASLIAVPPPGENRPAVWRFSAGRPDRAPFFDLTI